MTDPLAAVRGPSSSYQHPTEAADDGSANIRKSWASLTYQLSHESRESLRARGINGQISSSPKAALRWVYWKTYLSGQLSSTPSSWTAVLDKDRESYDLLRRRLLRAPDGNYPPGVNFAAKETPRPITSVKGSVRSVHSMESANDLSVNNPLSLDESNPWKTYYAALEVRKTILQDVERTFPEVPLFRRASVQQGLTNALFVWCLQNEDVGYRQGMHELLATLWMVRSDSAVRESPTQTQTGVSPPDEDVLQHVMGQTWIEHDVYSVFFVLMQNAKSWFEWRDQPNAATHLASLSRSSSGLPANSSSIISKQKAVTPIVAKCDRIQALLHSADPALAQHLDALGIEPQIFALRWVRLIFTREFALEDALVIWDGLFAADPSLKLVDYICLAMLIRVRNRLLAADYSTALQVLLRYPSMSPNMPHLFVQQAIQIQRDGANPSSGIAVVMSNRDHLKLEAQQDDKVPDGRSPTMTSSPVSYKARTQKFATVGRASSAASSSAAWIRSSPGGVKSSPQGLPASHFSSYQTADPPMSSIPRSNSSGLAPRPFGINPSAYLPEGISDFAKGLYVRSDLPQHLNSALANVSRTVAAAAAGVAASSASQQSASSGFPSKFDQSFCATNTAAARGSSTASTISQPASPDDHLYKKPLADVPESTDRRASKSVKVSPNAELAAALEGLTASNKAIGSALAACIDVLERDWLKSQIADSLDQPPIEGGLRTSQTSANTLMSFTALKHIRDVLVGVANEFDPATLPKEIEASLASRASLENASSSQEHIEQRTDMVLTRIESDVPRPSATSQMHKASHLPMTISEYARYGRQMILSDFGLPAQLRLRNAKILVVGAGGLGCPALQYLAAAGVGHISIIDHDVVESSNLARQILHTDAKIGMQKAHSAAEAAKQLNPHIRVTPFCTALNSSNARQVIKGQDLVLDCTDNPLTRYLVSDAAVLEGVQVVSGAAQGYEGQLVVLHKQLNGGSSQEDNLRGPCYRCLFPRSPKPSEVTNCEDSGVLGGITGIVGTMQALEAIKILAHIGEETPPFMTLMTPMTSSPFRTIKIRPRRLATCRACGDPAQVPEPMITNLEEEDYASFCGITELNAATAEGIRRTAASSVDPAVTILDVRPQIEFGIAKLPRSVNIPISTLLKAPRSALEQIMSSATKIPSSTSQILVVCKKGNDSQEAVRALVQEQDAYFKEKQDAERTKQTEAEPNASFVHPLGQPEISPKPPVKVQSDSRRLTFTDLIGGLRAYSRDKDPDFPVY